MNPPLSSRTQKTNICGPVGNIEALISMPLQKKAKAVAIICHPHPLHHGTMNNKVITTLAKILDKIGLATIRFNFRGVGQSGGKYGDSVGECDDLLAVYSWAKKQKLSENYVLAGFSFGSYICCRSAEKISPKVLITVAPAITNQDYENYPNSDCPWWLIQGELDEITEAYEVYKWANSKENPPNIIKISDASHFFHGKLGELEDKLTLDLLNSKTINW